MNVALFKYFMAKNGDTNKSLASALNIHETTLSNKLNSPAQNFSRSEIAAIAERWNLGKNDFLDIFFDSKIA